MGADFDFKAAMRVLSEMSRAESHLERRVNNSGDEDLNDDGEEGASFFADRDSRDKRLKLGGVLSALDIADDDERRLARVRLGSVCEVELCRVRISGYGYSGVGSGKWKFLRWKEWIIWISPFETVCSWITALNSVICNINQF